MYENLPAELRALRQFTNWRYEQVPGSPKPTKPLYDPRTGYHAKSNDSNTWVDFDTALAAVKAGQYNGIGFVLSSNDPYTFIDLDTYDPKLTVEDKERHAKIAAAFQGYAELSPSGAGLHLIIKGSVPSGRKRAGIEVYSSERYMTVTGNVWRAGEIIEQQELLDTLWEELAPPSLNLESVNYPDQPQFDNDNAVCDKAAAALNGAKFIELYQGRWQSGYASQSEADFALIDILAFYTKNREQIKRIFRTSALGQRDKAKREAYVNGMLSRAFDNQPPPIDIDAMRASVDAMFKRAMVAPVATSIEHSGGVAEAAALSIQLATNVEPADEVYALPPGLLGEIANYIYSSAPCQVPEIALCGAMGLMSGITGRSFNIGGTGLNHYLLMIAPTGSGKEAMASGIGRLMGEVQKIVPAAMDFIGPGEIRSDVALLKYLAKKSPSFMAIGGEFGHKFAEMASLNGSSHIKSIKRVMLDLYGKSGQGDILRPTIYSDAANDTKTLNSPAFTFLGESAPESFFNSVDETLVADGLLPRFTLIEYTGIQHPLNPNRNHPPAQSLVQSLAALCAQSLNLNQAGKAIDVHIDADAQHLLENFGELCRHKVNSGNEVTKQLWNRARLKAIKLAGLYAVGENWIQPIVNIRAVNWAIKLVTHNTDKLLSRFEKGEVGSISTDDKHVNEVIRMVSNYLADDWERVKPYSGFEELHKQRVLPMKYLTLRLAPTAAFAKDRRGAKVALEQACKTLVDNGDLVALSALEAHRRFGLSAKVFAIGVPETFNRPKLIRPRVVKGVLKPVSY